MQKKFRKLFFKLFFKSPYIHIHILLIACYPTAVEINVGKEEPCAGLKNYKFVFITHYALNACPLYGKTGMKKAVIRTS